MGPEGPPPRAFFPAFFSHAASHPGGFFLSLAISFAVLDLTGSVSDLGVVLFARILGQVILFLAGGVWADRFGRQQLMVAANAVRFVSQTVLGLLLVSGHAQIWQLFVLQLVHGGATGLFRPAASGLPPQLVAADQLQAANGLMYVTVSLGGIIGPAVGGLFVTTAGPGWAILGDGITFAIAAVLVAGIRPLGHVPAPRESFWRELAGGWHEVRSRTWLWASIIDFAVFQMVYLAAMMVLGPLIAKQALGGAGAWAAILAAFSAGTLVGNLWSVRLRPRRPLIFAWSIILLSGP